MPKFLSVLLYDQPFSRYRAVENRKCTEWPQSDLERLIVNNRPFTPNKYPQGQNLSLFGLRPAVFEIQGCWNRKNRTCIDYHFKKSTTTTTTTKWKPNRNIAKSSKFTFHSTTLVETLLGTVHECWGANLLYTVWEAVVWNFFLACYR